MSAACVTYQRYVRLPVRCELQAMKLPDRFYPAGHPIGGAYFTYPDAALS